VIDCSHLLVRSPLSCSDLNNKPPDAAHVRLLFAGKFLEDSLILNDINHFNPSDTTTFHLLVMPPPAENKSAGTAASRDKDSSGTADTTTRSGGGAGRCQCIIA